MPVALSVRTPRSEPGPAGRPARRTPLAAAWTAAVRLLAVLTGLATAAITLGPRSLVVGGMSGTQAWLDVHPRIEEVVERLGGVEPAGNLLLFVPFAVTLALAVGLRWLGPALVLLICSPFAVEWAQQYLPGRVPDGNDIVRNTTGLLAGFCAVAALRLLAAGVVRLTR